MIKSVRGIFCAACGSVSRARPHAGARSRSPAGGNASFSVKQTRVPLGSPVEVNYKFVVAADATRIDENFRVFVHFLDGTTSRWWTDDHDPPVPTTQWKPGRRLNTTTMFVPVYPYQGATKV